MHISKDIKQTQLLCQQWRDKGESIAFVPTMGCLHAGHFSLIEKAQSLADHVVVSIFVNPLQFDDQNDFLKYPDTLDEDVHALANFKVDLVFVPEAELFYPEGEDNVNQIELGPITSILEGDKRPGHFAGVATVVKRLFDLIQPSTAVFGEKDFQQLIVIKQLVATFFLDIKIVGMPTFREHDGLAMSSRNIRLSNSERKIAPEIFRQLQLVKAAIDAGSTDFTQLERDACKNLTKAGFIPDYLAICDCNTLLPPQKHTQEIVILIAAKLGEIRLIDNLRV